MGSAFCLPNAQVSFYFNKQNPYAILCDIIFADGC